MKYLHSKSYIALLPNKLSLANILNWILVYLVSVLIISFSVRKDVAVLLKQITSGFSQLSIVTKFTVIFEVLLVWAIQLFLLFFVIIVISGIIKIFLKKISFWKIVNTIIYISSLVIFSISILFALTVILAMVRRLFI